VATQPSGVDKLGALSTLAPELASAFASIASDIALVIGPDGVIRDVALGGAGPMPQSEGWVGQRWADTVTGDTRRKIEQLLEEARTAGVSRRREVNHPSGSGPEIPIAYAAIRLGEGGPVLAAGRDLRAIAAIQQRFIDTQQEMERDYWRMRQSESRYRLLFHVATDAVLVVDGESLEIIEANQAAERLFDLSLENLVGKPAAVGLDRTSRLSLGGLLALVKSTGQPAEIRARLASRVAAIDISATPFRGEGGMLLLLRARAMPPDAGDESAARLADFVKRMPDAVVIIDSGGRVISANPAFLALCGVADEIEAIGRPLQEWLQHGSAGSPALLAQVKSVGVVSKLKGSLRRGQHAGQTVEISAALLTDGDQECIGLTLRGPSGDMPAISARGDLGSAIARLVARSGDAPLPELLVAVTDLAERQLIQDALRRAADNLGAAAAALGVNPESLQLRMRHHGLLPDAQPGDDAPPAPAN
jgi:transcriptional regulator PpsR